MCHPPLSNRDPRATMNHHSPICYLRVILQEKDRSIAFSAIQSTSPGKIATKRHEMRLHTPGHTRAQESTRDLFLIHNANDC